MTGAEIIGALLYAAPALTARVPTAQIKAARLPDGTQLPALLVRTVSVIDRQPLKRADLVRSTERVSVTVRAASYADQVAIIRLVRTICGGWTGDVAGAVRASVLTSGTGPDVAGPGNTYEQAQDFRVSYDAPA